MYAPTTYTFKYVDGTFHVYSTYDNHPREAAKKIEAAIQKSLPLSLSDFSSSQFSAAFIAANKNDGLDIQNTKPPKRHNNLDYYYTITYSSHKNKLFITAVEFFKSYDEEKGFRKTEKQIYKGPFPDFAQWAETYY